jgi:hypothetical protein
MTCSSCGKNIPFTGKVCPFCHRDKSRDQHVQACAFLFTLIGGAIGWFIDHLIIGIIAGGIIGTIIGLATRKSLPGPPDVRVASVAQPGNIHTQTASPQYTSIQNLPAPSVPVANLLNTRLQNLEVLRSAGTITQVEYDAQRQRILSEL